MPKRLVRDTRHGVIGGVAAGLGQYLNVDPVLVRLAFVLLFFAAPHIDFYRERITGFGWPAMPEWAFILTSEMAFLGLMLLFLHRLVSPVTKKISSRGDYIGSILIFLVMLSGCLALARSYEALRVLHFFLAELLLLYFPFSALMHTFTFPFSRGFMGAHYGRRGVQV